MRAVFLVSLMITARALEVCVHLMEGGRGRGMGGGRADPDKPRNKSSYSRSNRNDMNCVAGSQLQCCLCCHCFPVVGGTVR